MSEKNVPAGSNPARERIWNDEAVMTVVDLGQVPDADVRMSDAALEVLRNEGVDAYEKYVAEHKT